MPGMMPIRHSSAARKSSMLSTAGGSLTQSTMPPAGRATQVPVGNADAIASRNRSALSASIRRSPVRNRSYPPLAKYRASTRCCSVGAATDVKNFARWISRAQAGLIAQPTR